MHVAASTSWFLDILYQDWSEISFRLMHDEAFSKFDSPLLLNFPVIVFAKIAQQSNVYSMDLRSFLRESSLLSRPSINTLLAL